jgi:hypothetical protein
MSSIITFFVARDDAAAAAVAVGGPGDDLEPARYGNFDVFSTLDEWQSILTDRDLEELAAEAGADVVSGDDEPLVLHVPDALTEALAHADHQSLADAAARWIELRAEEDEEIDEELALDLLGELATLSARAQRAASSLYCWIC